MLSPHDHSAPLFPTCSTTRGLELYILNISARHILLEVSSYIDDHDELTVFTYPDRKQSIQWGTSPLWEVSEEEVVAAVAGGMMTMMIDGDSGSTL